MTSETLQACPHPHEEDVWCMLCGGRVCDYCMVNLSGGQKLCRDCHHGLVELNTPMAPHAHAYDEENTSLLNPQKAPVTFTFVALLIGIYLVTSYPTFTTGIQAILDRFALDGPAIAATGQFERLITGNLLHANLTHLGFNLFALLIFGCLLEPRIHRGIYMLWLLLFAASCDLFSIWLLPNASIGASGIAYGLQSAFLILSARNGLANQKMSFWQTLLSLRSYVFVILLIIFSDLTSSQNLNIYGHLGGAVAGALVALAYPLNRQTGKQDWAWPLTLLILASGITLRIIAAIPG